MMRRIHLSRLAQGDMFMATLNRFVKAGTRPAWDAAEDLPPLDAESIAQLRNTEPIDDDDIILIAQTRTLHRFGPHGIKEHDPSRDQDDLVVLVLVSKRAKQVKVNDVDHGYMGSDQVLWFALTFGVNDPSEEITMKTPPIVVEIDGKQYNLPLTKMIDSREGFRIWTETDLLS